MKRKQFKVGDLVRVGREDWHYVKFGAVCRVLEVFDDGDLYVRGPTGAEPNGGGQQYVDGAKCRLAKQAMKKAGLK